jgi:hypothetical protein
MPSLFASNFVGLDGKGRMNIKMDILQNQALFVVILLIRIVGERCG